MLSFFKKLFGKKACCGKPGCGCKASAEAAKATEKKPEVKAKKTTK